MNVHSVRELKEGWEVTVYQSAVRLLLPKGRSDWALTLASCQSSSTSVRMEWDEDSSTIVSVEDTAG